MRVFFLFLIIIQFNTFGQTKNCSPLPAPRPQVFTLDERDLFIISEYKETEYQVFLDRDSLNLPANLSSVNYYIDINGEGDSSNIIDINYLYLQDYHDTKTNSGELFYLLSKKNIPLGKRNSNIRNAKSVDLYSELSCIVDMSFGYWKFDPVTQRIFLIFRDRTRIWDMNNFRVFAGLVLNQNIYLTKAMNTKDAYLFDENFKKTKEVFVKLPISLESVFYSEPIRTTDSAMVELAELSHQDVEKIQHSKEGDYKGIKDKMNKSYKRGDIQEKNQMVVAQNKITRLVKDVPKNDKVFNASIKYSYYPSNKMNFKNRKIDCLNYSDLSFAFLKRKKGRRASKYVLFKGVRDGLVTYSKVNLSQYKRYYSEDNQQEFIFINIVDPYDEKTYHTFRIPYSGKTLVPSIINFFRKKIMNS